MVEVVETAEMKKIIRRRDSQAKKIGVEEDAIKDSQGYYPNIQCHKCQKYGHYVNNCNSDKCYNCGRWKKQGKGGRDYRAEEKVEETINLALDDAINA